MIIYKDLIFPQRNYRDRTANFGTFASFQVLMSCTLETNA